jgi:hypothetical protein
MQGTVLYGTRDVRFEEVPEPKITKPTDAIIRVAATCVCGSDLWSYRGISPVDQPTPMGTSTAASLRRSAAGPRLLNHASSSSAHFLRRTIHALTTTLVIRHPAGSENS